MAFSKSKTNPPREKLFRLWNAVQGIVTDGKDEDAQTTEDHENRIRRHYDQLLSNLNVPEVVTQMFQSGKLTAKEHEHIRQFYSTPIRASEELLNIIILNTRDVYECFLESLKSAKQHHVYQMLMCNEEVVCTDGQSMSQHARLIRQNYDWLTETLNPDSGLLTSLIAKEVLSQREYGQVVFEKDPFVKNEILLSIISRKSIDDFRKFIIALNDTSQEHIGKRLTETPLGNAKQSVTTTVIKTVPTASSDSHEKRMRPKLPPKPNKQSPTSSPSKPLVVKLKPMLKAEINPSKPNRIRTDSTKDMVHKKSVEYLEAKFKKLPNELQTDVSTKLFLIYRKSSKDSIWKISFTKILQESRDIKRQNIIQAKAADENCERLMQETIQRERECKLVKEEIQREKTKAKTQLRQLQERINELEDRLTVAEKENRNLSVKFEKSEVEVENLKKLNLRLAQEANERLNLVEKLEGRVTYSEMKLKEAQEQLEATEDKLTEKDLALKETTRTLEESTKDRFIEKDLILKETTRTLEETREKLKETETKLTELEEKLIEAQTDADNSRSVDLEMSLSDLEFRWEEERKQWAEERKQLTKRAQELYQDLEGSKEKCLDLEQTLLERSLKYRLMEQTQEHERTGLTGAARPMTPVCMRNRCISDGLDDKYTSNPVLIRTIKTKPGIKKRFNPRTKAPAEERRSIRGLTILDKQLFVVSERSSKVEVYDSIQLDSCSRWELKELIRPMDIGSCSRNKCLYIFDCKGPLHGNEILRVHPNGKLIKNWSTGVELGYSLSVTEESNIILTDYNKDKLNEYSPDGQLLLEINLSHAGIHWPWHAIKLTNGYFVVSHGSIDDDLHRVCMVDSGGRIKKSFGGKCGSTIAQMNRPVYLSVNGNGFVMVADQLNGRVLLLDSNLEHKRVVLSKEDKHGLHDPWNIILDESNSRLFVADNESENQRILVFDFK